MKSKAVIGACFGDEGKGRVVDQLCANSPNALVIRFSGGHQAAHQVVLENGKRHIFSNFGSGTLRGNDTYWSRYCTVEPVGLLNELDILISRGFSPRIYIDSNCPITTPYDIQANQGDEDNLSHGSCGVGFGKTIEREEAGCHFLFKDLFSRFFKEKIESVRKYHSADFIQCDFWGACKEVPERKNIFISYKIPENGYSEYIFEGSQGLLLDRHYGFFPHVTRANTGTKNILDLGFKPEIYLVTRAYQTRHGNGPMTSGGIPHSIKPNPFENQEEDSFQGNFRIGQLDIGLLFYGICQDEYIRKSKINLVVTCLDLLGDLENESQILTGLANIINPNKMILSRSASDTLLTRNFDGFEKQDTE